MALVYRRCAGLDIHRDTVWFALTSAPDSKSKNQRWLSRNQKPFRKKRLRHPPSCAENAADGELTVFTSGRK